MNLTPFRIHRFWQISTFRLIQYFRDVIGFSTYEVRVFGHSLYNSSQEDGSVVVFHEV